MVFLLVRLAGGSAGAMRVQAGRILAGLLYFLVIAPLGLITRRLCDPLRLRPPFGSRFWLERGGENPDLKRARRPF